jgi:hypothetical protein
MQIMLREKCIHFNLQSEERGATPSRRSKSEGPPGLPNGRCVMVSNAVEDHRVESKEKVF